jgi:hypothetical protein
MLYSFSSCLLAASYLTPPLMRVHGVRRCARLQEITESRYAGSTLPAVVICALLCCSIYFIWF